MGLIVVDASAIVEMMAPDDASRCAAVTARLSLGDAAYAPAHLDLEVAAAIRGIFRRKTNPAEAAPALLRDFYDLPIRRERLSSEAYLRVWRLRDNMTAYDAAYVALAEELGASLVTCDAKFLSPPGVSCAIELIR
ncbi:MAG TPA: type II toxin-antitoxin system VapC family toxin [Actinocrinis sp.]|jgi:predicted nucleic acid-binding protein|uniref:type II toxin-antitoxin system VapC family toxin n=1 Tax=Actinocrinis sp. TaxID=1920516 RepID=UPI002DDCDA3A|nr:type II toxin-antitoxin system VapC family toxin [Actinocrinis sp.]HEV3173581.1 type II toxin-antitoxin system VapC family toxin [Actinocrinis sp.]